MCEADHWSGRPEEDHSAGERAAQATSSDSYDCYCRSSLRYRLFVPCLISLSQNAQMCSACYTVILWSFNILLGLTESQNPPGTPLMSPHPPPALTSTPRCAPPPPPPPPPLPPAPCPTSCTETLTVFELIRQRKNNEKNLEKSQDSGFGRGSEVKGIPSMLDVLKNLNQVKLRSVER